MQIDWTPVRDELEKWRRKNLTLPVWWRDDDAVKPTEQLERMIELSEQFNVPVHLATIPREATRALADLVSEHATLIPVVHGWSHTNHQPTGERSCEFGGARSIELRREEAAEGLRRLRILMGDRVAAMFVPPWNNVPQEFLPDLQELGFTSFSTCNPRKSAEPVPGLAQVNTHVDPLYWGPSKNLSNPELIVERIADLLKRRRQGKADNAEPFGLLTHHLAHQEQTWEFCRQYWEELLSGPAEIYRAV